MENIGMQDSLLSRFDLLFIILDKHERDSDRKIADHVMRIHRFRAANESDGERKFQFFFENHKSNIETYAACMLNQ